ncbi:12761_t:CDS:1, partial [Gigaspora margarita]
MANNTLNTTNDAITALGHALKRGSEKSLLKIDFCYSDRTQNPTR